MASESGSLALRTMDRWSDAVAELSERVEVRQRVRRYLVGLLDRVECKNGWQLAETIGEASPRGVQRLLNGATRDADGVRDDLRTYVARTRASWRDLPPECGKWETAYKPQEVTL